MERSLIGGCVPCRMVGLLGVGFSRQSETVSGSLFIRYEGKMMILGVRIFFMLKLLVHYLVLFAMLWTRVVFVAHQLVYIRP